MSGLWVAVLLLMGIAIGVVKAAVGDMIQEEARTRLGRIPFALIRIATLRVPPGLRDDLAAEWNAELGFLLTGTDGMPVTRLLRGIRYSAGFLLSARKITDALRPRPSSGRRRRSLHKAVASYLGLFEEDDRTASADPAPELPSPGSRN